MGQALDLSRQDRRASRHRLKVAQRAHTESVSSRLCYLPLSSSVVVDVGRLLVAQVSGVGRCGSPWACPICAPVVRGRRAVEIDLGLSVALVLGMGVEFLTLTVRHSGRDALAGRLDAMAEALGVVLSGRPWDRRKSALGYVGAIRAVEITCGAENGWHPHTHAVLIFERPLSVDERAALQAWLLGRWGSVCERRGFGTINEHGVDLRPVGGASEIAGYLTKVEGGWSAGLEIARADLKQGSRGTVPAVALLGEFCETGDVEVLDLWREYERATFGKRAIVWSPGLRARLIPDLVEVDDVEAAHGEGLDVGRLRVVYLASIWRALVRSGSTGEALSEVERAAGVVLGLSTFYGVDVAPLATEGRHEQAA